MSTTMLDALDEFEWLDEIDRRLDDLVLRLERIADELERRSKGSGS